MQDKEPQAVRPPAPPSKAAAKQIAADFDPAHPRYVPTSVRVAPLSNGDVGMALIVENAFPDLEHVTKMNEGSLTRRHVDAVICIDPDMVEQVAQQLLIAAASMQRRNALLRAQTGIITPNNTDFDPKGGMH